MMRLSKSSFAVLVMELSLALSLASALAPRFSHADQKPGSRDIQSMLQTAKRGEKPDPTANEKALTLRKSGETLAAEVAGVYVIRKVGPAAARSLAERGYSLSAPLLAKTASFLNRATVRKLNAPFLMAGTALFAAGEGLAAFAPKPGTHQLVLALCQEPGVVCGNEKGKLVVNAAGSAAGNVTVPNYSAPETSAAAR